MPMYSDESIMRGKRGLVSAAFGILATLGVFLPAWADEGIEAVTRPSKDVTLSYTLAGRIADVLVKDGDQVQAGQVLVRLDDAAEQVALAKLQAESEDVTQVLAAEAQLAQSRVDLEKTEWAFERGAATNLEVEHAKLQVRITELSLQLARFKQDQAHYEYERFRLDLDRMRLTSSIDGVIELVSVEVGESVDPRADVIRVVAIDPLWIDVPTPLSQALGLQLGQTGEVIFIDEDADDEAPARCLQGQVVHIASVADAASDTLVVRLEAPNPDAIPAGQRVWARYLDEVTPLSGPVDSTTPSPEAAAEEDGDSVADAIDTQDDDPARP